MGHFSALHIENNSLATGCESPFRWIPQNLNDDKSTLVQVMVWCHQATNHHLEPVLILICVTISYHKAIISSISTWLQAVHYSDVIMSASQITSLTNVYSTDYTKRRSKKTSKLCLRHWPFVRGIHQWSVNSPHKGPVTRKMFSFDGVIMESAVC